MSPVPFSLSIALPKIIASHHINHMLRFDILIAVAVFLFVLNKLVSMLLLLLSCLVHSFMYQRYELIEIMNEYIDITHIEYILSV